MSVDEDFPIDIQCNKLVEWLISRRHCNIKWKTKAEIVKAKIVAALKDMPATKDMESLVEGSCFHYYKCKKIVDVLKDTEKDSKNIFGRYSSKRMKDWQEIIQLYEKENLYLVELSSKLIRNVNYEIPSRKKQIKRNSEMLNHYIEKGIDSSENYVKAKQQFAVECSNIGIQGIRIRFELLNLAKDINQDFDRIALLSKKLFPVVEYYRAFVEFSISSDNFQDQITPLVKYISKYGNTTIYEWKNGEAPSKIIKEDKFANLQEEDEIVEDKIDWGMFVDEVEPPEVEEVEDLESYGIVLEEENETNGFEIVSDNEVCEATKNSDVKYNVAKDEDALTLLENQQTRRDFMDELIELKMFIERRLKETQIDFDLLSINHFQVAPSILKLTTVEDLQEMLKDVEVVISDINSTKMILICQIFDSPKFVEQLANQLKRFQLMMDKYLEKDQNFTNIKNRVDNEIQNLEKEVLEIIDETKEWRELIQDDISKRYNNRKINLMGAINFL